MLTPLDAPIDDLSDLTESERVNLREWYVCCSALMQSLLTFLLPQGTTLSEQILSMRGLRRGAVTAVMFYEATGEFSRISAVRSQRKCIDWRAAVRSRSRAM